MKWRWRPSWKGACALSILPAVVEATLAGVSLSASRSLADLLDKDGEARRFAMNKVGSC
jgi:1-deoxy-D-xylulose-5-phosphate reductoisomerase